MLNLSGKVALVTGAGSGIGRGSALALAEAGADVFCMDVVDGRAEATAAEVKALGRKSGAFTGDVRSKEAMVEMAAACVRELGRLDIAFANAGIGRGGGILTMTEQDWDDQIDVNLKGVFLTVQACAREMVRQNNGGRIISTASLAAERPSAQLFAYCASKSGVRMMTRCWAQDLAPFGITVNCIGPGIIDTPLAAGLVGEGDDRVMTERHIPAGRVGYPADIGKMVCWLASDEAEYITGTYNLVDGGLADRGAYSPNSEQGQAVQSIRDARARMSGGQLLEMIDRMTAQARAQMEQTRAARGVG
ncbi:MAG TPA: SDR family NAD(P)-dependent oxidoreductase [Tepidiformaceae bacterium]|nr:SDR family NAD(P)-dependent oxidoreductase [Tepidiformaceae bacterium]